MAVSIPSHTSSILQVHDLAVFGPLKTYYNNSLSDHIRLKGPNMQLQDLPSILQQPWHAANNSFNIISGFRKAGIFSLDLNWIEKNQTCLKVLAMKPNESRFNHICEKRSLKYNFSELIKDLDPLNLFIKSEQNVKQPQIQFQRRLSDILVNSKDLQVNNKPIAIRRNMLGEDPSEAKILNELPRLRALAEEKEKREKLKANNPKKRKEHPSSQPVNWEDGESNFEEILSFKPSNKQFKLNQ